MSRTRGVGTSRQVTEAGLKGRLKRMNAKAFNTHLPEPLHQAIKLHAKELADSLGGQPNMNKVMVQALYDQFKQYMNNDDRDMSERFIALL